MTKSVFSCHDSWMQASGQSWLLHKFCNSQMFFLGGGWRGLVCWKSNKTRLRRSKNRSKSSRNKSRSYKTRSNSSPKPPETEMKVEDSNKITNSDWGSQRLRKTIDQKQKQLIYGFFCPWPPAAIFVGLFLPKYKKWGRGMPNLKSLE